MRLSLKRSAWLWMVLVLLLAVLPGGRRINSLTFTRDETWTLMTAGARNYGPYTLSQVLEVQQRLAPDQAFGWDLLINRQGAVAGWNTVSVRAWSFFFGLLALAMVYRTGRHMFGQQTGVGACLLLLGSSLFIQYFHISRAFTPVVFFSSLLLFAYWRVAIGGRPHERLGQASLLAGGIGLLYSHYFGALLIPALGLFHLLFVRKDRRWWLTSLLFLLILLAALPELTVLHRGVEHNVSRYAASRPGMDVAETLERLAFALTNGIIRWPGRLDAVLLLFLPLAMLTLTRTRSRHAASLSPAWFLGFTALVFFLLVMGVNHFVPVLMTTRIRYLLALWPPLALLTAAGIAQLGGGQQRVADWLLAGLVVSGIAVQLVTPYYLPHDYHEKSIVHLADQALMKSAQPDDFLILSREALPSDKLNRDYYLHVWEFPREVITGEADLGLLDQMALPHSRFWVLAPERDGDIEQRVQEALRFCRRPVDRGDLVLTLYARSDADCA